MGFVISPSVKKEVERSVWSWLEEFAVCVRARDFTRGRALFAKDAHGFGTVVRVAGARAKLEKEQWGWVWPRTSGFRFERAGSRLEIDEDGLWAVAMVTWKACNEAAPKRVVLDRRGRATIVLRRDAVNTPWLARHTHFSFDPPMRAAGKKTVRGRG